MRILLSVATATVALAVGLGPGAPRPELELGARRMLVARADRADAALAALEAELVPAVDVARTGAARVVAGDEPPAPMLRQAAELVASTERAAAEARDAVVALDVARRAWRPTVDALGAPGPPGELASIGAQLEAAARAADDFAEMRRRATGLAGTLERALVALDAGDLDAADGLAAEARAAHEALTSWEVELATLPVWLQTADEMIGAVERIVEAAQRRDDAAAAAAAADFAALADEGATADRALRIAMGEGGSAVTAAPLERLASVLSAIADLRGTIASVREAALG